jgi:nitroreductase
MSMLENMDFRYACKIFDKSKKISDKNIRYIMEVTRKSPSSFGMEPWKFLVITNDKLKEQLKPYCWDQSQITTCSHLIVVLAKIDAVKPQSGIPLKRFERRAMPQDKLDFYINLYSKHLKETLSTNDNIYHWTSKQTYLAVANMMSASAELKIDSCPIEGFEKQNIEQVLKLDKDYYQVSMLLALGYGMDTKGAQHRLNFDDVVEFID